MRFFLFLLTGFWALTGTVLADAGLPQEKVIGLFPAVTPVQAEVIEFHNLLMPLIAAICFLVLGLLLWIVLRYNAKRHPVPSKTSHHTMLEIIWTAIPAVILIAIAFPSMRLLYMQDKAEDADMTIKAIGHQWYWSYEYPDHGDISFDSMMVADKDLKPGQPRNLEVDNRVVVPVGETVRVLVTANDVLHSWGVPAFGVKKDAVPGRLNETWFRVDKEGVYYGMCYELCGPNHAFMPIAVEAVSPARFAAWVAEKDGRMPGDAPEEAKPQNAKPQDTRPDDAKSGDAKPAAPADASE